MNTISAAVAAAMSVALGGIALAPQASAATSLESRALSVAKSKLGAPYRYGAAGPSSFDCSGLVLYSFKRAGKALPRTAQAQYAHARHISWKSRRPGDLVAVGTSPSRIAHVGIYAGFWRGRSWMINANTGRYRGYRVVDAPIAEYLGGGRHAYYAHVG